MAELNVKVKVTDLDSVRKAMEQVQRERQQVQRTEWRDIQRIHADKLRMSAVETREAARAGREQARTARAEFREIQKIHAEKMRMRAAEARAQSRSSFGGAGANRLGGAIGGGLGIPIGIGGGYVAAIIAGVAATKKLVDAGLEAENTTRVLSNSALEAGLSFEQLERKAVAFGESTATSVNDAAATLSKLTRLATQAGRISDLDLITRRFADLAAARGLAARDLDIIVQQILSGQDEGLNRLGLPDPSKIYKEFADSIGTTVAKLTQMQKVASITDAVLRKAELFDGAAEARLKSTAGQVDTLSANFENLKSTIGKLAVIEIGPIVAGLNTLLAGGGGDGKGATSFLSAASKLNELFTGAGLINKVTGFTDNAKAIAIATRDWYLNVTQFDKGLAQIKQSGTFAFIRNEVTFIDDVLSAAVSKLLRLQADRRGSPVQEPGFREGVDIQWREHLGPRGMDDARADFQITKDEADKAKRFDAAKIKHNLELAESFTKAREEARAFLAETAQKADADNPFVALFDKMETSVDRARKSFGVFGEEFAQTMARVEQDSLRAEIATARFASGLSALKQIQEARRLDEPLIGSSGAQDRAADVVKQRLAIAAEGRKLELEIKLFEQPFRKRFNFEKQREFDDKMRALEGINTTDSGRAGKEAVAQAMLALTGEIDPLKLATSTDPKLRHARFARIDALKTTREGLQKDLEESLAKEKVGKNIASDAMEQLALLKGSDLKSPAKLKQFLAITGELSEKELTPELRAGRAAVLRMSAQEEQKKEKDATDRLNLQNEVMKKLNLIIGDQGVKIAGDGASVTVSVDAQGNITTDRTGTSPTAADTAGAYNALGTRRPGDVF